MRGRGGKRPGVPDERASTFALPNGSGLASGEQQSGATDVRGPAVNARRILAGRHRARRLIVERLEDRLAPAAFTVNTTADTVATNLTTGQDAQGNVSLRSATQAANNLGGSNSITLPAGAYNLTIAGPDEDNA